MYENTIKLLKKAIEDEKQLTAKEVKSVRDDAKRAQILLSHQTIIFDYKDALLTLESIAKEFGDEDEGTGN